MNEFINLILKLKQLTDEQQTLNILTNILFFDILTDAEKEHLNNLLKDNLEFIRNKKQ